jgi:hypothetical protein
MLRHIRRFCDQYSGAVNVIVPRMYIYNFSNKVFFLGQGQKVRKEHSNLNDQPEESICGWRNWSDFRILTFLRAVFYIGRVNVCFVVWQHSAGTKFNDLK